MKTTNSQYEQPKKLPKGRKVSQTVKAPKIKGMPSGYKVGGKVTPGGGKI